MIVSLRNSHLHVAWVIRNRMKEGKWIPNHYPSNSNLRSQAPIHITTYISFISHLVSFTLTLTSLIIIPWNSFDHEFLSNQFLCIIHKQTQPLEKYDHQCWEENVKKVGIEYLDLLWSVDGFVERNLNADSKQDLDGDPIWLCDVMSSRIQFHSPQTMFEVIPKFPYTLQSTKSAYCCV